MAASSRGRNTDLQQPQQQQHPLRKWKVDRSPERTKIWSETNTNNINKHQTSTDIVRDRKAIEQVVVVPVVYYLSRNALLEHPHFMQVPLSSPTHGLFLRDVINRLNLLRGRGMASLYSWSCKRSYKNGFVWHDLTENDLIHPAQAGEYVLKGSEILLLEPPPPTYPSPSTLEQNKRSLIETTPSFRETSTTASALSSAHERRRRRNQSWSSVDLTEYKVSAGRLAADAATQTDDKRIGRRRRANNNNSDDNNIRKLEEEEEKAEEMKGNGSVSNSREEIEISPPPSDSSPETLESLMKADGRLVLAGTNEERSLNLNSNNNYKGMRASTVLMSLISCGSMSFRDCGANSSSSTTTTTVAVKEQGLPLISGGQCKGKMLPRGGGGTEKEIVSFRRVRLEDKEYFSGSLVEGNKVQVPTLKRSNSYNEDRILQLQQAEEGEIKEGVRTKCIPLKSKAVPIKKDNTINVIVSSEDTNTNNSPIGSKRFQEVQQLEKN